MRAIAAVAAVAAAKAKEAFGAAQADRARMRIIWSIEPLIRKDLPHIART